MTAGDILTLGINRSVPPKLPYHPDRDLQAVVRMYFPPNPLAVTQSLPVKSAQDLVDYTKNNPDSTTSTRPDRM
jgi:tripartite-type tricarboxylate transporter receptor subunit TctC